MSEFTHPENTQHDVPGWFRPLLSAPPRPFHVELDGSPIKAYRCSPLGEDRAEACVVLSHGFLAHAHCLSFLGVLLGPRFQVVAYDSIGMGDSPMHPSFGPEMRGRELLAVARAAGFLDDARPTFAVAHSQGGHSAMSAIESEPGSLAGLVVCDMMLMTPEVASAYMTARRGGLKGEVQRGERPRSFLDPRPHKLYPNLESILERYVLAPPQPCGTPFLLEHVARHSVQQVDGGYVWKFDPRVRETDGHSPGWWMEQPGRLADLDAPKAIVYGEESRVFPASSADMMVELTDGAVPVVGIPGAHHHLMLDRPRAFATTLVDVLDGFLQS